MTKRSAAAMIALALVTGSAAAADLPALKSPPPPPLPPPPLWTGFYAGLNAGYAWGGTNNAHVATGHFYDFFGSNGGRVYGVDLNPLDPNSSLSALAASGVANLNQNGFIGGGQIGYNYQFYEKFVVGLEADLQGAGIRGEGGFAGAFGWNAFTITNRYGDPLAILDRSAASATTITTHTDWLGTVRGRLGYTVRPNLLLYATGGLAYGGVKAVTHQSQFISNSYWDWNGGNSYSTIVPFGSLGSVGRYSETRVGWTVGGGLEWLFHPNVSVKAEYLYYDLGTARFFNSPLVSVGASLGAFNQGATRIKFDGHIARLGLNYHFFSAPPVPVLAKY